MRMWNIYIYLMLRAFDVEKISQIFRLQAKVHLTLLGRWVLVGGRLVYELIDLLGGDNIEDAVDLNSLLIADADILVREGALHDIPTEVVNNLMMGNISELRDDAEGDVEGDLDLGILGDDEGNALSGGLAC